MEPLIAMAPHVPAEEKELVNDCGSRSTGRFFAAYGEEVTGLDLLPPRRPPAKEPIIPANFLLRLNRLLEVIWVR